MDRMINERREKRNKPVVDKWNRKHFNCKFVYNNNTFVY